MASTSAGREKTCRLEPDGLAAAFTWLQGFGAFALDDYDARTAGEAIESFLDQLSNWYVRRNRRRFWKSTDPDDKRSAYLTLYECLNTVQTT